MPADVSKRLGRITSWKSHGDGLTAETAEGHLQIRFYTDRIVRLTIGKTLPFEASPYAVVAHPQPVQVKVTEKPGHLELRSSKLVVRLERDPVRFSFLTAEEEILNEEVPGLGTSWIGEQVTSYRTLQEGERFIGLGEKTGPLDRRGHGYQHWNTDAYSYSPGQDPLYCSTPFYIGIHHRRQYGIYLDNTHKTFFNFGASNNRFSSFSADAGDLNYYFIQGDSVAELIEGYTHLTGRMPLPPKWSLGYQQCRYSYYPDYEVRTIAKTFRDKKIPADAIVLDIHYMDKYKIFTWDNVHFPDPKGLIDYLKSLNFEVVVMCDPGIKAEEGYEPYDDGKAKDVFVKYPDGEYYSGQVWPGWCHFPDFTHPDVRKWWAEKLAAYSALGINGYWNDMNEIATWGNMLPENIEFHHEGEKATARKARNIYGMQMARSTYEGARQLLGGKRPFNLSRSGFSGIQRYAAVWTGDNVSYDDHMMLGIRMVNSMGVAGIAFAGYDVGGFTGDTSVKLFARWITLGAFSPFFRGHTMVNSLDAEPWSFGEEVENISRNFIRLRYQLMPYLYSVFHEATRTGMPVQRTLAITHTHDARVYQSQYHNQYFFGPSFLIAPVVSHQAYAKIFLPGGDWYSLYDGTRHAGNCETIVESPLHRLPVFIAAGSIIPMQPPVEHTGEQPGELHLHVYSGGMKTTFDYYEDDGSTFRHEAGEYHLRRMTHESKTLILDPAEGTYQPVFNSVKLVLHGDASVRRFMVNGKPVEAQTRTSSFFLPLERYDPINEPDSMGEETVVEATFPYSNEAIKITW
ncbi:MAG: glycoside hydrolase family 31 protein [Cyclobacteriaceae bacterium]|nr:glycoside hydrolase family 31 protein [Cyclobacteriaceae bacterium]